MTRRHAVIDLDGRYGIADALTGDTFGDFASIEAAQDDADFWEGYSCRQYVAEHPDDGDVPAIVAQWEGTAGWNAYP